MTGHGFKLPKLVFLLIFCALVGGLGLHGSEPAQVKLMRTPDGGIQPQAAVDSRGAIHLIYFKGEAGGGDIYYVRQEPGQLSFSRPIRVNTQPRSAMAMGSIRGAQMAPGKNGRVHIAWNGPTPAGGTYMDAPMLYTRLNDAGNAFEPERNVITQAWGLDGGGSVAADDQGNVFVMWHAPKPGNTNGEAGRAVFVARSSDDGKTFTPERPAISAPTGACGCCGMKALADNQGNVFALYRSAADKENRNETLLVSHNLGMDFEVACTHGWKINACPMSSAFLSETAAGVLAAAETHGRVFYIRVDPATGKISEPVSPDTKGKYPVAVANADGQVLLVWTEDTAWAKGGSVAWQIFDQPGGSVSERGRAEGVPAWSFATVIARPDGSFTIFY